MYLNKTIMKKRKYLNNEKHNTCSNHTNDDNNNNYEESNLVTMEDNHIYFYDDVNTKTILQLIKFIKTINNKLLSMKEDIQTRFDTNLDINIYLHINSGGGYITDAFAAINYIKKSQIPIISIIDGYAASAATFLSVICHQRKITNFSTMLIHQMSSSLEGTFHRLADDNENNIFLQNQIKKIYIENSKGKLTDKRLNKILKHDLMWNAEKCLKNGLVDEII